VLPRFHDAGLKELEKTMEMVQQSAQRAAQLCRFLRPNNPDIYCVGISDYGSFEVDFPGLATKV